MGATMRSLRLFGSFCAVFCAHIDAFVAPVSLSLLPRPQKHDSALSMAGGFGKPRPAANGADKKKKAAKSSAQKPRIPQSTVAPSVTVADRAGQEVKKILDSLDDDQDPFWQLITPLIQSEFPANEIERVLGFIKYSTGQLQLPDEIVQNKWRPQEVHKLPWHTAPAVRQDQASN